MKTKGLTFIEAAESGKPFKLPSWTSYAVIDEEGFLVHEGTRHNDSFISFRTDWLTMNTWELKVDPIKLEVGRFYYTEKGNLATIESRESNGAFLGTVYSPSHYSVTQAWHEDGTCYYSGDQHNIVKMGGQ